MKIGFTVGVFDCFHEGHEKALFFCAERCDHLIVGLCSDAMVQRLKGHTRPYQSYQRRRQALVEFTIPERIIRLEDLDYTRYLQMVDVWFKCTDQLNEIPVDWPGIVWFSRTPGISTSATIPYCHREECRIRIKEEKK